MFFQPCLRHQNELASQCVFATPLLSLCIFRPRRSRSAAAYSDQTFPWTICRSVDVSVCPCSALRKNGESDPDAVWRHRSDGSRDEAVSGVWRSVHGKGYFWGRIWGAPLYLLSQFVTLWPCDTNCTISFSDVVWGVRSKFAWQIHDFPPIRVNVSEMDTTQ